MLKKETRILGISAPTVPRNEKQSIPVVGVVYRGHLWLDGVFTCRLEPNRRNNLTTLARTIIRSRQYSQIRVVILSREQLVPGRQVNIHGLSRRIKLPVVAVISTRNTRRAKVQSAKTHLNISKRKNFLIDINGKRIWVSSAGLDPDRTRDIFTVGCAENGIIPEAVRVADLIAKRLLNRFYSGMTGNP